MRIACILLLISALFTSCAGILCGECWSSFTVNGVVLDKLTHEPVRDAVLNYNKNKAPSSFHTDSMGKFAYAHEGIGCYVHIFFNKEGYKTKRVVLPRGKKIDTIYLVRERNSE